MDIIIKNAPGTFAINLKNVCAFCVRIIHDGENNDSQKFAVVADMDNGRSYVLSNSYFSDDEAVKAFNNLQDQIYELTHLSSSAAVGVIRMKG